MAADAFRPDDPRDPVLTEGDGLVAAVPAGDVAAAAADAKGAVHTRENLRAAVQAGRGHEVPDIPADQVFQMRKTLVRQVIPKTLDEILDDALPALHDGGTHLHVAAPQAQEFHGIAPGIDSPDAGKLHAFEYRVHRHLQDETEGDGLHGSPGVARNRLLAGHDPAHRHGLDGVDGRDSVRTAQISRRGDQVHGRNVGGHLRDDRDMHGPLYENRIVRHQFRILSHVAAHADQTHLGAGEIELDGIDAGVLRHMRKLDPLLVGVAHDGGDDDFGGIVLLQLAQDLEVHLRRILGELLHVAESGEGAVRTLHGVETRRDFIDILQADRLVIDAGPAGLEGRGDHLVVGADGGRGEEEGILAGDPAERDVQGREVPVRRRRLRQGR